ncbi:hypothetical protein OROMI_033814 [Orobanche minor]
MMWMKMGYNDAGDLNTIQDPFMGHRRLRPLMPRPTTASTSLPCFTRIYANDHFLGLNHHLAAMVEQSERLDVTTTAQVVVSSRWNPTPEQLLTLEELYRRGTRTPSAEQIQQITSQLRQYGKIEGKNVFYWFQNHKARERQKHRRQLESLSDENNNNNNDSNQNEKGEKREPMASNRTAFEVEQTTKNWASPTNSSTVAEGATTGAERKSDGWVLLDAAAETLLHQGRNATWQMMHLSCSTSAAASSSSSSPTNLIINCSSNNSAAPTSHAITNPSSTMHRQPHDFSNIINSEPCDRKKIDMSWLVADREESQTLQLFPLQSGGHGPDNEYMDGERGRKRRRFRCNNESH